jgi:hypothetical protein
MAKPTKKQIDELAQKLRVAFFKPRGELMRPWGETTFETEWRRVAAYVLENYERKVTVASIVSKVQADVAKVIKRCKRGAQGDFLTPPVSKKKPKSCRLVNGKVVCS